MLRLGQVQVHSDTHIQTQLHSHTLELTDALTLSHKQYNTQWTLGITLRRPEPL